MELLNQKEDSKHYLQTLQFSDDKDDLVNAGVTDQERSTEGFSLILYISHEEIHGANYRTLLSECVGHKQTLADNYTPHTQDTSTASLTVHSLPVTQ